MVIFAFILFAKRIFLGDHSVYQPTCDSILLRLLKKFDIYSHMEKKNNILKQADVLTCLLSYWWYWNSSFFTFLWSATGKHFSYIFCYYFINLFQRLKEISSQEMKNSFAIRITMLRFFFSSAIISEECHSEPYYSFTERSANKIFPQADVDLYI